MSLFDEMKKTSNINAEQILNELLNAENIELKTHILQPLNLTTLKTIAVKLRADGFIKSADTIDAFIDYYLRYMVSWNRQSREEIVRSVIALRISNDKAPTTTDKLIGNA